VLKSEESAAISAAWSSLLARKRSISEFKIEAVEHPASFRSWSTLAIPAFCAWDSTSIKTTKPWLTF
jgi:hypothetical protein